MLKILVVVLVGLASQTDAASESWYLWSYVLDGVPTDTTRCARSVMGTWMQVSGPFKDSKCTVPGYVQ
jgi:hypothetical protein